MKKHGVISSEASSQVKHNFIIASRVQQSIQAKTLHKYPENIWMRAQILTFASQKKLRTSILSQVTRYTDRSYSN